MITANSRLVAQTGSDNHFHDMFQNGNNMLIITADLNPMSPPTIGDGALQNCDELYVIGGCSLCYHSS